MSVQSDVDRGLKLVALIERLESQLKKIEGRLHAAALDGDQVDLEDADREGKQFLAKGSRATVPVVLTADLLVKSFAEKSPLHEAVKHIAQEKIAELFQRVTVWKTRFDSGKQFRAQAAALLGAEAPTLISLCTAKDKHGVAKSAIKVEWDRAKEVA